MATIKVLHLITGLPIGGAEKVLLDLCANLDRNTIENHVIGLNDERDFNPDFEKLGISVSSLDMQKTPSSLIKTSKTINAYIKEHDICVLHAHMFHPIIFALIARLSKPNLKVVFTSHNENIGSKAREVITYLLKPFRDVDVVFSKEMINPMYKADTRVIPNGIDTSVYNTRIKKNDIFTFINIGVLREQKNQKFLPSCARYLLDQGIKDFEIQIVGGADASGDEREAIQAEIDKHNVKSHINLLGSRRDIPELLQKAHCFILPSHFEGLPIALLEAGAARLPIVSTPVGAIPTVIDETNGYLATIDLFAQAMMTVYHDYKTAGQKAITLSEKIEQHFSIKHMSKMHQVLYVNL